MRKLLLGLILSLCVTNLAAEVISVRLKWNDVACARDCRNNIQSIIQRVKGVSSLAIDPGFGEATIGWDPNVPFSLDAITTPIRSYGVRLDAINISVRGTISHDSMNVYLVSSGDRVRFLLLGPTRVEAPGTNRYVMERSAANHPLGDAMKAQLLDAENKKQVVTVDGQMFNVEQHTLNIVISSVKYPKPGS
jgi:hypothetical protein